MKKGFTLIELLVVIGILGILAAGLLAAIDPLEQLKKGRDTSKRDMAIEMTDAVNRYFAVYGTMPWGAAAIPATALSSSAGLISTTIDQLTTTGELKPTFKAGLGANAALLTAVGGLNGAGFAVCFDPESKSMAADTTNTIYTNIATWPPVQAPVGTLGQYYCSR